MSRDNPRGGEEGQREEGQREEGQREEGQREEAFPLHEAAKNPKDILKVAGFLKRERATANDRDLRGRTPAHYAAEVGAVGTVKILCNHDADPHALDTDGMTPILLAAEHEHGTIVDVFVEYRANLKQKGLGGRNVLHQAVVLGLERAAVFLAKKASELLEETDDEGFTPVQLADQQRHTGIVAALEHLDDVPSVEGGGMGGMSEERLTELLKRDVTPQGDSDRLGVTGETLAQVLGATGRIGSGEEGESARVGEAPPSVEGAEARLTARQAVLAELRQVLRLRRRNPSQAEEILRRSETANPSRVMVAARMGGQAVFASIPVGMDPEQARTILRPGALTRFSRGGGNPPQVEGSTSPQGVSSEDAEAIRAAIRQVDSELAEETARARARVAEEEAVRRVAAEEAARARVAEEEAVRRVAAEEAARARVAEEEAVRRVAAEEAARAKELRAEQAKRREERIREERLAYTQLACTMGTREERERDEKDRERQAVLKQIEADKQQRAQEQAQRKAVKREAEAARVRTLTERLPAHIQERRAEQETGNWSVGGAVWSVLEGLWWVVSSPVRGIGSLWGTTRANNSVETGQGKEALRAARLLALGADDFPSSAERSTNPEDGGTTSDDGGTEEGKVSTEGGSSRTSVGGGNSDDEVSETKYKNKKKNKSKELGPDIDSMLRDDHGRSEYAMHAHCLLIYGPNYREILEAQRELMAPSSYYQLIMNKKGFEEEEENRDDQEPLEEEIEIEIEKNSERSEIMKELQKECSEKKGIVPRPPSEELEDVDMSFVNKTIISDPLLPVDLPFEEKKDRLDLLNSTYERRDPEPETERMNNRPGDSLTDARSKIDLNPDGIRCIEDPKIDFNEENVPEERGLELGRGMFETWSTDVIVALVGGALMLSSSVMEANEVMNVGQDNGLTTCC